jgi:glycosyltransferase involved in cell wall biosynthesis
MKILAVDHNALDPTNRSFYDELARQPDVQLRLIIPEKWFDNYKVLNWDGSNAEQRYVTISSKVFFSKWTHRLVYLVLRKEIIYFDPDILFMNSEPENYQTFQAAMLLALDHYRAKLVFTSWRNIDHSVVGFPYKLPFLHVLAEKYVLDGAAHGIVFNDDGKRIFEKIGFPKITVIPPYVDTSIFHKITPPAHIPGTEETFVLGYIGRLVTEKGIDTLLQAVKDLPFPWSVVLIGDGRAKSALQNLARQVHITDNIHWIAPRPRLEIPSYLSGMGAIVLPSRTGKYWREQFGRILIEAMACETPVIGSDSGEIPKVIGDAGLVFPEGNAQELRDRIVALHDDAGLRDSLIAKGMERISQNFTLKDIVRRHLEVFKRL